MTRLWPVLLLTLGKPTRIGTSAWCFTSTLIPTAMMTDSGDVVKYHIKKQQKLISRLYISNTSTGSGKESMLRKTLAMSANYVKFHNLSIY
jgi:hypothetical protein